MEWPPWFLTRLSRHIQSCFTTKRILALPSSGGVALRLTDERGNSFARRGHGGCRRVGRRFCAPIFDCLSERRPIEEKEGGRVGIGEEFADDAGGFVRAVGAAAIRGSRDARKRRDR